MEKPMACWGCPLYDAPCVGMEVNGSDIVLVGKHPANNEVAENRPFVGQSGQLLRNLLNELQIKNFALHNAVKCLPHSDEAFIKAFKRCSQQVVNEIVALRPKVVVLLGEDAQKLQKLLTASGIQLIVTAPHPRRAIDDRDAYNALKNALIEAVALLTRTNDRYPYEIVSDPAVFVPLIKSAPYIVVDLEVSGGYDPNGKALIGAVVLGKQKRIVVVPLTDPQVAKPFAEAVLDSPKWVAHNALFELVWLSRMAGRSIEVTDKPNFADTLLMQYALNEALPDYSLKTLAAKYFHVADWSAKVAPYLKSNNLEACPKADLIDYCAKDAEMTDRLYQRLDRELNNPTNSYARHLLSFLLYPAVTLYARATDIGIRVNTTYLDELGRLLQTHIAELEAKLKELAPTVNPASPVQLSQFLKERNAPPVALTPKKKHYSTREEDLRAVLELTDDALLKTYLQTLLDYRALTKLYSTYIEGVKKWLNSDGRVRPHWKLHGTVSGRITCINPPLQTIPAHDDYADKIRAAFVPDDGCVFIEADFSNHELRVAINLARDHVAAQIFLSDRDFHRETAARVFKVPYDEVTDELRTKAKAVNFGLLYGMTIGGLAKRLGIEYDEAERILKEYSEAFPIVWRWRNQVIARARVLGYVEVPITRRRRHLPHIKSNDEAERARAEREAINTPVQALASDFCVLTALKFSMRAKPSWTVLLTIHDSILIQVPETDADEAVELLKTTVNEINEAFGLLVPLKLDISVKKCWAKGSKEGDSDGDGTLGNDTDET